MLQVAVGAVGKAFGLAALRIELDEVKGHLFDAALGFVFGVLPRRRAQLAQRGFGAFFGGVGRDFVQAVDAHVKHVAVAVHELNGLLLDAAHVDFLKAAKLANSVVDVGYKVADLQGIQLLEGEGLGLLVLVPNGEALVAFKEVVVDVGDQTGGGILPSAVQRPVNPVYFEVLVQVLQNRLKAVALAALSAHNPQRSVALAVAV